MEKLNKTEKLELAFLLRQEINEGEELIKELETKEQSLKLLNELKKSHKIRKQRFEKIAKKLEIEL